MAALLPLVAAVGAVALLLWRLRNRSTRTVVAPRFGTLNLMGEAGAILEATDTAALAPVLGDAARSSTVPPRCSVLFLYCDLERDGRVKNSSDGLRELIRAAGATVVVVASENSGDSYIAAAKARPYGRANLVMTLARRGAVFPRFFVQLFESMRHGVPMPVAWVKLAPQTRGEPRAECPETIFACEAGQVSFQ